MTDILQMPFSMCILKETYLILIEMSLKFVRNGPTNSKPVLVQMMDWLRIGDIPLSEPVMAVFTHA